MKIFFAGNSHHYLLTQKDLYRIRKKQPGTEQFRQDVNVPGNSSATLSFRAIAEDDKKNVYASYYIGIAKKPSGGTVFSSLPLVNSITNDNKSTFSLNYRNGYLLWNNAAVHLASGKIHFMMGNTFGGHCTQYLNNDTLWLFQWATSSLHCFDLKNQQLTTYPFDKSLGINGIIDELNDLAGDATGKNLWACTKSYGIYSLTKTGKLLKQYSPNYLGLTGEIVAVNDLQVAGDNLWFGCNEGLGLLNIATGKPVIYKNPLVIRNEMLVSRTVFSILPDPAGNLYLGSSNGLLYFNTTTKKFYNLADDHPLANLEFNRASAFRSSDGRYYFGTTDGLYSFKPDQLEFFKSSNSIKPVKVYGISIFNSGEKSYRHLSEDLNRLDELVLKPFDTNIEFNVSVPEFNKDVYYSYRVKGQNETWTDYNPENKIFVYGLLPGRYILEIKASTDLSDENVSYYSLPVIMKQVWYKKDWVITLFILTALGSVFVLTRWLYNQKLKRQKDLAELRTKISSDLHDDVGTILSGLAMQSQMLAYTANDEQKESLNEIGNMSRDAMEHMRDIVWAMDSRKDKFENLVDRMRAYAEKNLAMKNMTHEFIVENIDAKKFIDPEKKQAVYFIFKEAVANIIKHSDGRHAAIRLTEEKGTLRLLIHDNGTQQPASHSDGLGMSNMKMRAEKIGGQLTAKYENGFMVELTV
jgi:signal transduction histidine kinase